jgi:prevent-host-death family protein
MSKVRSRSWQLQDAKNQLGEVIEQAARSGPQIITRRGVDAAVVVSSDDWAKLTQQRRPLIEVLRRAPRIPHGLTSPARETPGEKSSCSVTYLLNACALRSPKLPSTADIRFAQLREGRRLRPRVN